MSAPATLDHVVQRSPGRSRRALLATALIAVTSCAVIGLGAAPAFGAVGPAPSGVDIVVSASGTIDSSCGSGLPSGVTVVTTINAGIAAASPGQQIYVCAGTYNENVVNNKDDIDLLGPNWNDPTGSSDPAIIKPLDVTKPAVTFQGGAQNNCGIRGFTIDGGTYGILSLATSGSGWDDPNTEGIRNNSILHSTVAAIETSGIDQGLIAGNAITPAPGADGIVTKDAAGALDIQSNTIRLSGSLGTGISVISTATSGSITTGGQTIGGATASLGNTVLGGGTGILLMSASQASGAAPYINTGTVQFNTVSDSAVNGIKLDGAATTIVINDNTIDNTGASGILIAAPSTTAGWSTNTIELYRNTISNAGRDGIEATGYIDYLTAGYTAGTGNIITDPARDGVSVTGFQTTAASGQNTRVNSATTIRVASNDITGAGASGVLLDKVDGADYIWWNTISGSGTDGVTAINSDGVSTAYNDITGNAGDGIHYDNVYGVYAWDNTLTGNGGDGIELTGKTTSVFVDYNIVNQNAGRGIAFTSPSVDYTYNYIAYNNVAGNTGLDCFDSSTGIFYNAGTTTYLANYWAANSGGADSRPAGLCGPDQLTVTAPQYDGEVGNAYVGSTPARPPEATGTVTWSVSKDIDGVTPLLPAGLTLNTATGQITGTPTSAVVDYDFILTATDGAGKTGSYVGHITIYPTLQADDGTSHDTVGTAITPFTPTVTGGNTATTKVFSVAPGTASSLPAGLSLDPATGKVTGTPTVPGTFTVTFKVTDQSPNMEDTASLSAGNIELPANADTYTVTFTIDPPVVPAAPMADPVVGGVTLVVLGFGVSGYLSRRRRADDGVV